MNYPIITAAEAACYINNGDGVGISGFTLSGTPKTVLREVAKRAEEAHAAGKPFKVFACQGNVGEYVLAIFAFGATQQAYALEVFGYILGGDIGGDTLLPVVT